MIVSKVNDFSCPIWKELLEGELKYFGEALVIPIWIGGKVERWIVLVGYQSNSIKEKDVTLDLSKL